MHFVGTRVSVDGWEREYMKLLMELHLSGQYAIN